MGMFDLFRTEPLSNNKKRNLYKMRGVLPIDCCKKIMDGKWFACEEIRLTLAGEEMEPDTRLSVSSFEEILSYSKQSDVSSCLFRGLYKGKNVSIVVDFGMTMLYVASEDPETIKSVINELEA